MTRLQEARGVWSAVWDLVASDTPDVLMWTRTGSYDLDDADYKLAALDMLRDRGIPSVAYHLDRWWGLDREGQVAEEPFFRCEFVCTADGGHEDEWAAAGVRHYWFPPGVSATECGAGVKTRRFTSDICFVGSWRPGYHAEWTHRPELVAFLRREFRGRVKFWPERNQPAVRGLALRDLYASVKVAVGDSCLVPSADGAPLTRYWSDRIPETLGRGAFLLHPDVEGLAEAHPHLVTWHLGDWDGLGTAVEYWLRNDAERAAVAAASRADVLARHTYEVRMAEVLELLCAEGALCVDEGQVAG